MGEMFTISVIMDCAILRFVGRNGKYVVVLL